MRRAWLVRAGIYAVGHAIEVSIRVGTASALWIWMQTRWYIRTDILWV
jgi:hypothetical protein